MNNTINTDELIKFLSNQNSNKGLDLTNAISIFLNHVKLYKRPATYDFYDQYLNQILLYMNSKKVYNTSEITSEVINDYMKYLLSKGNKPQTVNHYIKSIRCMINFLKNNDYIDHDVFKFKALQEEKSKIKALTKIDIQRILDYSKCLTEQNQLIILLMLTTGIRTTELVNIENDNIDFNKNIIKLTYTKNHEIENIYIHEDIKDLLFNVYNPNNKYLFAIDENRSISNEAVKSMFARIKRKLNIELLSPHKIRHYYATNIYNKTHDYFLVSKLLRHKNIEITKRYLDIENEEYKTFNTMYSPLNDFAMPGPTKS